MAVSKKESSQTEIENYDIPKLSETSPSEYMRKYNLNEIKLAGKVVSMNVSEPQPKIDKQTNEQAKDENGSPAFWTPFYSVDIIFEGGELRVNLNESNYQKLVIGERYLFTGMMGLEFKKVQPKFHAVMLIA